MQLYIFNCLTGRFFQLLMGLQCQTDFQLDCQTRVQKQQHFYQPLAIKITVPKAILYGCPWWQHLHFISHIYRQPIGLVILAESTGKCCYPAPNMQTRLYWDNRGTCKMHHSKLHLCNLFLLAYLGIKTLPSMSQILQIYEDN